MTEDNIQDLYDKDSFDDAALISLLEYAQFGDKAKKKRTTRKKTTRKKAVVVAKPVEEGADPIEVGTSVHPLIQLEEFLNSISFTGKNTEEDDIEVSGKSDSWEDQGDEDELDPESAEADQVAFTAGSQLKKKLIKTLKLTQEFLAQRRSLIRETHKVEDKNFVTLEEIQAILIGIHLILEKAGDSFIEKRYKLIVRYRESQDVRSLEKQGKTCGLKWMEKGPELDYHQRAYSANNIGIENLQGILDDIPGIKKLYQSKTPSLITKHSFFVLFDSAGNKAKDFIINSLGSFLYILAQGKVDADSPTADLFEEYRERLFFRAMFLMLNINWVGDEEKLRNLLLLNCYHFLLKNKDQEYWENGLAELRSKYPTSNSSYDRNYKVLTKIVNNYTTWKDIYDNDRKTLISELSRNNIGRILFKGSYGFMELKSLNSEGINGISPLGLHDENDNIYLIKNIKSGVKAVFYESDV